jgi:hypothetical protein
MEHWQPVRFRHMNVCSLLSTFILPPPLDSLATGIPEERYQQREGELYKSINRVYCRGCGQQGFIIVGWGDSRGRGIQEGLLDVFNIHGVHDSLDLL